MKSIRHKNTRKHANVLNSSPDEEVTGPDKYIAGPLTSDSSADLEKTVAAVQNLKKSRDHSQALNLLIQHGNIGFTNIEFSVLYARAAAAVGDMDTRKRVGNEVVSRFGGNARALTAAAQALEKAVDLQGARAALERAIQLTPTDARVFTRLASLASRMGDNIAVASYLEKGIANAGESADILTNLYKIAIKAGEPRAIAQIGEKIAAENPKAAADAAGALVSLGEIELAASVASRLKEDQREGALGQPLIRALRKKLTETRDSEDAMSGLRVAMALASLAGDPADAAAEVAKGAKLVRNAARAFSGDGNGGTAKQLLRDATQLLPDNAVLLREYGVVCKRTNDSLEAMNAWAALGKATSEISVFERAVNMAHKAGAWERGIELQRFIIDKNPASEESAEKMDSLLRHAVIAARKFVSNGEYEKATGLISALLKEDPQSVAGLSLARNLRKTLQVDLENEDSDIASARAKLVLDLYADDVKALKIRAVHFEKEGNRRAAAELWERLASGRKGNPSHWRRAARLYARLGDEEHAAAASRRADQLEQAAS